MKTRIISAMVGIVILLAVLLCPFTWVLALVVAAAAALAVWELLKVTGRVQNAWLLWGSVVFAALEVLIGYAAGVGLADRDLLWLLAGGYLLFSVLVTLRGHATVDVAQSGTAWLLTLYATAGFTALAIMRSAPHGFLYLLLALIIPWSSDTGAYFVGTFLGRHKMAPVVSPKKSWEGFFGGWAVSVLAAVLAGVIHRAVADCHAVTCNLWLLAGAAFVLAPLSVCGDLFASVIKRQSGIKDYGNLMPGHGGVMDRFDSVVMIAPLLCVLLVAVGG